MAIAIVRLGDMLIASVPDGLSDHEALELQASLNDSVEHTGVRGVLLDISVVDTIDSFLGRLISDIARGVRLLGAHTIVVGMQPAVAITLVELGLELKGVHTVLNAEKGMTLLKRLLSEENRNHVRHGR